MRRNNSMLMTGMPTKAPFAPRSTCKNMLLLYHVGLTHGGCPVVMGSKWILNKWIQSYNQWDTLPCRSVNGNISRCVTIAIADLFPRILPPVLA